MSNDAESDVVHLHAGEHLPAVPVPSLTTEMLKQLLEQMLENERRRLRNEYVRIGMLFLVLLAVLIGSGLWFTHSLLDQLRAERQTTDRSLQALLQRVAPEMLSPDVLTLDSPGRSAPAEPGASRSTLHAPASAADTNTVQAQADIKRLLSDLESKKQALADMLQSQNAQTKNLLQSRDSELQILHERMQEVQRKIMNAVPPEARPVKEAKAPTAIEAEAADSLTVRTTNAVTLRLPIPAP
jgi:cytoskeletal protein RodZ